MFLRSAFEDNKRCQQFESLTTPDSSLVSCCCYLHEATDPEGRPTVLPIHKSNVYACVISDWCSLSSQSNWNRNYPSCVSTRRFNIYFWNTCNKIVSTSKSLWPSASIFGCKQLLEPRFRLPCEPESDPCQLTQDLQAACTPDSSPVSCCCFLRHEETSWRQTNIFALHPQERCLRMLISSWYSPKFSIHAKRNLSWLQTHFVWLISTRPVSMFIPAKGLQERLI